MAQSNTFNAQIYGTGVQCAASRELDSLDTETELWIIRIFGNITLWFALIDKFHSRAESICKRPNKRLWLLLTFGNSRLNSDYFGNKNRQGTVVCHTIIPNLHQGGSDTVGLKLKLWTMTHFHAKHENARKTRTLFTEVFSWRERYKDICHPLNQYWLCSIQ